MNAEFSPCPQGLRTASSPQRSGARSGPGHRAGGRHHRLWCSVRGIPHLSWRVPHHRGQRRSRAPIGILPGYPQHTVCHLADIADRTASGRGRCRLPDGVRHQPPPHRESSSSPTRRWRASPASSMVWWACWSFAQTLGFKTCLLSGSLTLVIMNLPTIIRTTQESLKTVPAGLPGGGAGAGCRQVAHHPHHRAALQRGRHRHRLHPGRGPHRGRERRAAVHRRRSRGHCPERRQGLHFATAPPSPLLLYMRAFEDGDFDVRLGHRRSAAGAGAGHQPGGPAGEKQTETEAVNNSLRHRCAMPPPSRREAYPARNAKGSLSEGAGAA